MMKTMIDNLINGNLTDAISQSRRFSHLQIQKALMDIGWSFNKATRAADWLKGIGSRQAYHDAE